VAWTGYGKKRLAARKMDSLDLTNVPDWFSNGDASKRQDWFDTLGLAKAKAW